VTSLRRVFVTGEGSGLFLVDIDFFYGIRSDCVFQGVVKYRWPAEFAIVGELKHVADDNSNAFDSVTRPVESVYESCHVKCEVTNRSKFLVGFRMLAVKFEIAVKATEVKALVSILDAAVEARLLADFAPTDSLVFDRPPAQRIESFDIRCAEVCIGSTVFIDKSVEPDQSVLDPVVVEIESTLLFVLLCGDHARQAIILFVFVNGVHRFAGRELNWARKVIRQVLGIYFVSIHRHRRAEVSHVGAFAQELAEDIVAELLDFLVVIEVVIVGLDLVESVFEELAARILIAVFLHVSNVDAVAVVIELVA
jgi:hypothetical protein